MIVKRNMNEIRNFMREERDGIESRVEGFPITTRVSHIVVIQVAKFSYRSTWRTEFDK